MLTGLLPKAKVDRIVHLFWKAAYASNTPQGLEDILSSCEESLSIAGASPEQVEVVSTSIAGLVAMVLVPVIGVCVGILVTVLRQFAFSPNRGIDSTSGDR